MTRFIKTLSASILTIMALGALPGLPAPAHAQQFFQRSNGPVCGERASFMGQLKGKYAELPKSMGLASNGSVLEVLTATTGSWSILVTSPDGVTCLISAGENWEDMEQQNADYTPS